MSIFSRFKDIVNSNVNALLDKAEDPEKMVKLMIQEMEDTLIELKTSCAATMAATTRTKKNAKKVESEMNRWQDRAILAIQKGREDLAKEALIEKKNSADQLSTLLNDIDTLNQNIAKSKDEINQLNDKLVTVKLKYKTISEKARRAEEERATRETLKNRENIYQQFDQMEDKINQMNAMNEMDDQKINNTEKKFADLEGMSAIDKELEALKNTLQGKEN
jgi:phage shock protein A